MKIISGLLDDALTIGDHSTSFILPTKGNFSLFCPIPSTFLHNDGYIQMDAMVCSHRGISDCPDGPYHCHRINDVKGKNSTYQLW